MGLRLKFMKVKMREGLKTPQEGKRMYSIFCVGGETLQILEKEEGLTLLHFVLCFAILG